MAGTTHSTPLISLEAVALDTETTGLDARTARILEIGAIRVYGERVLADEAFDRLVNPGTAIPDSASRIHGLTAADLAGAPGFGGVAEELESFLGPAIVIGHNIDYDLAILAREYALAGRRWRAPRALDVRILARAAAPTLAGYSLDALCDWLDVRNTRRHRALPDATAAAEIFVRLIPLLRGRQIRTLAEAQAACDELREQAPPSARGGWMNRFRTAGAADASRALERLDSFPYRHRVRDVMSTPAVILPGSLSPREAIRAVLDKRVSSVLVRGSDGRIGIVTERDLLRALNREPNAPQRLEDIMSHPLQTVPEDAFVYRAIGRMDRLGIRHLAVDDRRNEIVGVLTQRGLLHHRATSAIALGDEVDIAPDVPAMGTARAKLPRVAQSLVQEDANPNIVAEVISAEICAFTARAACLAEQRMVEAGQGAPPVPYALMVLGSAGRGESLLGADQDNAIVYDRGARGSPEDRWFEGLGGHIADILDHIGIPYCQGGVMAKNAGSRHSVGDWEAAIDGWIERSEPADMLSVDIFFDAVPVHGEATLAGGILDHAYDQAYRRPRFLMLLSAPLRDWRPPLTLFGRLRKDAQGRVDLKKDGLLPIFTGARALAIRQKIRDRSTPGRLEALRALGLGQAEEIDAVIDAHRVLLGAVLDQQLVDVERGVPVSNKVEVSRLSRQQRIRICDAFETIGLLVNLVNEAWA